MIQDFLDAVKLHQTKEMVFQWDKKNETNVFGMHTN